MKEVIIEKEVITCDVSPVAMFYNLSLCLFLHVEDFFNAMIQSNYFHMTIVHPRPLDALILNNPYFFIILLTAALVDAAPNSDGEDDSASSTEAKADPLQLVEEELKAADLGAQQPAEGF